MAQTGFTPIQSYYSNVPGAVPTAANLLRGELAINTSDGKLFYEDASGVVQVIATKATATIGGSSNQVQYNSSGALAGSSNFTFNGTTATINTLNLSNALGTIYGGTGLNSYTAGDIIYASNTNVLTKLGIGANGTILTSTGLIPQWSSAVALIQAAYPVGSIYMNATNSTSPAILLGFGIWSPFATGRVLVGFDSGNALFDAAEETGGSYDAVLVSHTHAATVTDPGHTHTLDANSSLAGFGTSTAAGSTPGTTGSSVTGITVSNSTVGVSATNQNIQPYITVYMWKRIV